MPRVQIDLPDTVADRLTRQAHSLFLGRQQYIRAILAHVASQDAPTPQTGPSAAATREVAGAAR